MSPVLDPDITSQWTPADSSTNHLEVAETEVPGLLAFRSTYDRRRVVFATGPQMRALADQATNGGEIGKMIANGGESGAYRRRG